MCKSHSLIRDSLLVSHLESSILYSENTPKGFGTMGLNKVSGECSQISCSGTL